LWGDLSTGGENGLEDVSRATVADGTEIWPTAAAEGFCSMTSSTVLMEDFLAEIPVSFYI